MTSNVRELYISLLSASIDNIIKLLTIVATVFLPLSLLAGVYGTNFTAGFFQPGSGPAPRLLPVHRRDGSHPYNPLLLIQEIRLDMSLSIAVKQIYLY